MDISAKLSNSIVVYKKYDDVLSTIDSIERFTDKSIQKKNYIIDNSCFDANNLYKQSFLQSIVQYDAAYVDTKRNLGFGKDHNFVISQLDSEYHAVVNPYVLLYSDEFAPLIEFLQKYENIGLIVPILSDENNNVLQVYRRDFTVLDLLCRYIRILLLRKRNDFHTMNDIDKTKDYECPFILGIFFVVKTDVFKSFGGFDDRYFMYAEDADLCCTIRKKKVVVHPAVRVVHKWEKTSLKNFKLMLIHMMSLVKYFDKWGWVCNTHVHA